MSRFFWRILLSTWLAVAGTTAVTLWVATLIPVSDTTIASGHRMDRLVALVARDLRAAQSGLMADDHLGAARDAALDLAPMFDVFILAPDGRDVLGRDVSDDVRGALRAGAESRKGAGAPLAPRVVFEDADLSGYTVVAVEPVAPISRTLARRDVRLVQVALLAVASALAAVLLARFVVRPVRALQQAGRRVAAGDLSVRVAHSVGARTDDIAQLAHDFDAMTARIDTLLSSQQRLMRDVSHELRSPLARLQALISIARQSGSDADLERLDRMEGELERLDALIGDILTFARLQARAEVERHPTDIVDLVQTVCDDAAIEAQVEHKQVLFEAQETPVIEVDSGLVHSAIDNVVRNALRHTPAATAVRVSVDGNGARVRVTVEDDGPGVPESLLTEIFEPFVRVDSAQPGRYASGGIGLAIAQRSVRLHAGVIRATNRDPHGLRVEIVLPTLH